MFKRLCFFLVFSAALNLIAQNKGKIKFKSLVYDYGTVNNWNNEHATFEFKNISKLPIAFLPIHPTKYYDVSYPKRSIKVAETGSLQVTYYTERKGKFEQKIPVYINQLHEPVLLTIRGNIKSFSPQAIIACPSLRPKQEQTFMVFNGTVYDKFTKQPIDKAKIYLSGRNEQIHIQKTNKEGDFERELAYGLYQVTFSKDGYFPVEDVIYLNKMTPNLSIYLEPINPSKVEEYSLTTAEVDKVTFEYLDFIEEEADKDMDSVDKVTFLYLDDKPEENNSSDQQAAEITKGAEPNTLPRQDLVLESDVLSEDAYLPNNIVFLIDVSLSMNKQDKMKLLKASMAKLTDVLREKDKISIITFASRTNVVIEGVSTGQKRQIKTVIDSLKTGGLTYGVKGLESAYELIEKHYSAHANNQLILATDGELTNKNTNNSAVFSLVKKNMRNGIVLSVIGFGDNKDAEKTMKKLAYWGKGSYLKIIDAANAELILVEEIKKMSEVGTD